MAALSSSRSDSPSGPKGVSVFPAESFFTSSVLDDGMLLRACSTGLAFAELESAFGIAAFNTSALYMITQRTGM